MGRGQELLDAAREGDRRTVEKIIGQICKRSGPFTSLRRGAGVNVQDDNGYTPLHHACLRGHKEIVQLLLSVDASPCVVDKKGATPLHLAAWKGDANIVNLLLAHNNPSVNIDHLTSDQETALLIAARSGYVEVVEKLLANGADVNIKNIKEESALDLAAFYGRLETVQHLLRVRPQLVDPYKYPISRGRLYSATPLHRASKNGHKDVVTALINSGVDPNIRTYNGTALHEAACFGKASVVRILLAKGADLNAVDRRGKTVKALLADYSEEATKRVKRVIHEHENLARNTYDSGDDYPPFPVQDSPTSYAHSAGMFAQSSYRIIPLANNNDAKSTNLYVVRRKVSRKSISDVHYPDDIYDLPPSRHSADSLKSTGPYVSLASHSDPNIMNNDEIDYNNKPVPGSPVYRDSTYQNIQFDNPKNSRDLKQGQDQFHLELKKALRNKKPKPLPKPKDSPKTSRLSINETISRKTSSCSIAKSITPKSSCASISETVSHYSDSVDAPEKCDSVIYENHSKNIPDDVKVQLSDIYEHYVTMDCVKNNAKKDSRYKRRRSTSDAVPSIPQFETENSNIGIYATMDGTTRDKIKSNFKLPNNYEPSTDNYHIKGDKGCIYAPMNDPSYIYVLHPNCLQGDSPPFLKSKDKIYAPPCFCPKNGSNTLPIVKEDIFYSCEDVYVNVNGTESAKEPKTSVSSEIDSKEPVYEDGTEYVIEKFDSTPSKDEAKSDSVKSKADKRESRKSSIFRKKLSLMKQVLLDWKAPETQKNTNLNVCHLSPSPSSSSITKNHPQSFVKKLASKCLGLKSKFNSAPNISNSAGLESVVDNKLKIADHKSIGNSKFFKILSKKEESGEVVCNDEFDTISLDRLGTLNRDTVVNRSNRSCPGFKTSLPNITENIEISDNESIADSVVITEIDCDDKSDNAGVVAEAVNRNARLDIFEPRQKSDRKSVLSSASGDSTHLLNECYEPYEFSESAKEENGNHTHTPVPPPRPTVTTSNAKTIYENISIEKKGTRPTPAVRTHIPPKIPLDEVEKKQKVLYENVSLIQEKTPDPLKRTIILTPIQTTDLDEDSSSSISRTSSMSSSDSLLDETNLEDILLSEKSKSFRHSKQPPLYPSLEQTKDAVSRTMSNASELSHVTQASAIENVDCTGDVDEKLMYLSMTGTLPNKKPERKKKKVLFRHKTFTNIELDRNSTTIKDLPKWDGEFLKETLAHYHIKGTGHCIYQAPSVQEFIYIFNRDTLYKDVEPFTKVPNDKRDSYFETAICFCRQRPPKHHNSAEDLLEKAAQVDEGKVLIDFGELENRQELTSSSFRCFCDSGECKLHESRRSSANDFVVKFSVIKKSISTPDITLDSSLKTDKKSGLSKIKSVPSFEEPYAVVTLEHIIARNKENENKNKEDGPNTPIYTTMSQPSTISSSSNRPYSVKDIAEVISLNDSSVSTDASLNRAYGVSLRKSSSSEYSGHWSLQSCNSNVTIKSDASFKSCIGDSDDGDSDGTLHSDDSSDAETVKSDVSTSKRPWVHSDSFRFGPKESKTEMGVILEEYSYKESDCKIESGISVEGSESSSEGDQTDQTDQDSGVPRMSDISLGAASLERESGVVVGVRSGSGRRRWDEAEGTSEGDALSVSSAASSCAPLHLAHHHEYSKVSPTPPKKPPRRNLSVSPTHANSPSSGYSYELRPHARSQDDLDDIQGAKHYLKHGRSIDQYVDGKLSYSEYEENHNSPRIAPIPNPRPSLKTRTQPVAITAMYENVVIKEQNPRRKLRRNNLTSQYENYEPRMENRVRKYSNQERSSLESLLDDQSMNSPSDCERFEVQGQAPLSPTHYDQPPTPDHPPPTPKQAENSIHERIRPLSQEYKRRSALRDSYTETDVCLLRVASAASVASGATDRSGNTDCVEEYVCDVPFAGLFKGSTTTLDGIGLRPMPAERPKTLRKLKSVYDASPTDPPPVNPSNLSSNGQASEKNLNGVEDEVRRRSNTTSSTHSGDKSLSILSPFDEQEEWAKISEIMASFGSKLVRESVFVSELEQEFTSRLGLSCSESSLSPSVASNLGLWLAGIGLHDYEPLFLESGFDDVDFVNGILDDNDIREMGIEENDRQKILESSRQLPLKIAEISNNYNNNNLSKNQNESVDEWLRNINLEQYSDTFRKHLYVDMDRVRRIWEVELTAVLEIQRAGHRKRILASVSGEQNGPLHHIEDINTDLNTLKSNIQQLKEEIKEKLPPLENLKAVPPPVVPTLAPPGGETLKRSKKNRPAPQPPRPSDLEIRAPSELMVGVPGALKTQWKHQPFVLVTGAVTYVANYLGSTVVKELRGTESTKKSIQKLKKSTKEPRDSPDIILSISYRGVKFLNTITRELICEHEIRNIHCACQDADDLTHFAYITKDHATKSHYCHVFRVATMDQATEVILTLGEAFEVAYQMALREQSNRNRVTQSLAKTPTHDPMTTTNKEKPNLNHGRSHSITEIKLNGHQLKIAPIPASLSNEDFQSSRPSDGSRSPRTPLLKAPIASTEEL